MYSPDHLTGSKGKSLIIIVYDVQFSGENGVESSLMFSLQPQECRSLRVQFRPTRAGGHAGALRITHRTKDKEGAKLLHKVHHDYIVAVAGKSHITI